MDFTNLTPIEQEVLRNLLRRFQDQDSVSEPVTSEKPTDLRVSQAQKILEYASTHGYTFEEIAIICNAHYKWPGVTRNNKPDTFKSLMNHGFKHYSTTNTWGPHLKLDRCDVIVEIFNALCPDWDENNEFNYIPPEPPKGKIKKIEEDTEEEIVESVIEEKIVDEMPLFQFQE